MNEAQMLDHLKKTITDLTKSPNKTDGYDCLSEGSKLYIELKARRTHYPTLLLEEKKYNFLIGEANRLGMSAQYINWTPEGMWVYDLNPNSSSYTWEDKWLPQSTDFGSSKKIMKTVTFLDTKHGRKIL
jgi:hypothetical protein